MSRPNYNSSAAFMAVNTGEQKGTNFTVTNGFLSTLLGWHNEHQQVTPAVYNFHVSLHIALHLAIYLWCSFSRLRTFSSLGVGYQRITSMMQCYVDFPVNSEPGSLSQSVKQLLYYACTSYRQMSVNHQVKRPSIALTRTSSQSNMQTDADCSIIAHVTANQCALT